MQATAGTDSVCICVWLYSVQPLTELQFFLIPAFNVFSLSCLHSCEVKYISPLVNSQHSSREKLQIPNSECLFPCGLLLQIG